MKKQIYTIFIIAIISLYFFSCNKDNPVTTNGGGSSTGNVTNTFTKTDSVNINIGETNDYLTVDSTGTINSFNFALNRIENVSANNIDIFLLHGGVIDTLLYMTSNTGTNFIGTNFSDTAAQSIQNGSGNFTGYYKPYRPLSKFKDLNINGQWNLKIISRVSQRTGVIKSWGITITYRPVLATQGWPTAIGNIWMLARPDSLGIYHLNDTMSIPYTYSWQGKTLYRFLQSSKNDTIYINNESDGIYMYGYDSTHTTFMSRLIMKYPVNVGDMFIGGGDGPDTVYCTSVSETRLTPSGTFTNCIKYEDYKNGEVKTIFYLKPGIGLVRIEHYQYGMMFDPDDLYYYHLN